MPVNSQAMGRIYAFPLQQKAQNRTRLMESYRLKLIELDDAPDMLAFIQLSLPTDLPEAKLQNFKLDLTYNNGRRCFVLYVSAIPQTAGMPFTFVGPCAKSVLYGCIDRLFNISPIAPKRIDPIEGIKPLYVGPLAIFEKKG